MNLRAHLRPYRGTLLSAAPPAVMVFISLTTDSGWVRWWAFVIAVFPGLAHGSGQLIASWVFRVPALVVDATGVQLPVARLHVPWDRIIGIRAHDRRNYGIQHPTIELVVSEPKPLIRSARWWERGTLHHDLRTRGTPVVIRFAGLDRPMEPFLAAICAATGLALSPEPPPGFPPSFLPPPPPGA